MKKHPSIPRMRNWIIPNKNMIPNMQFGEILCVSGLSTVENSTLNMLIGMVGQLDKHMIVMKKSHLAQIQGHLVTLLPLDFSADHTPPAHFAA